MKLNVTLQQIADELNTSKVTVSRALSNKPGVSSELRKKILDKAEFYGYVLPSQPNFQAKAFAFLVPQRFFLEFDRFYTVIFLHLNQLLQTCNIILTSITFTPDEEKSGKLPLQFDKSKFDGIFVVGEVDDSLLETILNLNMPTVLIDFSKNDLEVSQIIADNYSLGYEVTNYLLQNGHKRIGFVGDYKNNQNICDRYMGFQKAIIMHGLSPSPQMDIVNNDFITGLYTLNFEMPQHMPTAFVCNCDLAAYYLYEKLKSMGLRIPEDVSVISFDNTEICKNMTPPLTSMEIDKTDFANLAFKEMQKRITNPLSGPKKLFVHSKLIIRNSVNKI